MTEDDTGATAQYISVGATLTSPAGVDYDLFVYCTACGGSLAGSSESAQAVELVNARWEDNFGLDNQRDILIHVRYAAGHSSAPWTLSIQGRVTVSAPPAVPDRVTGTTNHAKPRSGRKAGAGFSDPAMGDEGLEPPTSRM